MNKHKYFKCVQTLDFTLNRVPGEKKRETNFTIAKLSKLLDCLVGFKKKYYTFNSELRCFYSFIYIS